MPAGGKLTDLDDPHGGSERVNVIKTNVPSKATDWKQITLRGVAPKDAASGYLWIHSSTGGTGVTDFDDFRVGEDQGITVADEICPPAPAYCC